MSDLPQCRALQGRKPLWAHLDNGTLFNSSIRIRVPHPSEMEFAASWEVKHAPCVVMIQAWLRPNVLQDLSIHWLLACWPYEWLWIPPLIDLSCGGTMKSQLGSDISQHRAVKWVFSKWYQWCEIYTEGSRELQGSHVGAIFCITAFGVPKA